MAQQTPFPPPQYGPPQRNRGPLVLVVVLGLVLVIVLAVGAVVLLRADKSESGEDTTAGKPQAPEAVQFRPVTKAEQGTCDTTTPAADGIACGPDGTRYSLGKVELDGTHVSDVTTSAGPTGAWNVALSLDADGAQLFARLTTDLAAKTPPQNQLAIVVRGRVVTAPVVSSAITGGKVEINSNLPSRTRRSSPPRSPASSRLRERQPNWRGSLG
ncbi:hypothetical protein GCM10009789_46250 [Kribbella sancticallisti]|uniref:SecDF P1 head subdomain domain-containing protein n=1 Tax=Kribbella sancticallisti TaxID=460087 RepID=A0ABN2DV46_9ACTN